MLVDSSIKPELPSWMGQDASEVSTGTTLVAVEFADGVVLGADTRTSMGSWVANRVTDKLTPMSSHVMACRSGSAADTQAMADAVRNQLEWYEIEFGAPASVHTAAHLFKNIGYDYRDQFSAGIIVGGWDKEKGGQVYSVPIGGALVRQAASIGGSGSTYLYGFMDAHYKPGMEKEKAVELVKQSVTLAINRDGSSGGCCR
jgi:20S proteasome subunit beta 1